MVFLELYTFIKLKTQIHILPALLKSEDNNYYYYSMRNSFKKTGLILFKVDIENQLYNFLIDTGANVNLLSDTLFDKLSYSGTLTGDSTLVNFSENPSSINKNAIINFSITNKAYSNIEFVLGDCNAFNMQETYGIDLHGVLGSIFLQENNWAIDYEKLLIKIPKI